MLHCCYLTRFLSVSIRLLRSSSSCSLSPSASFSADSSQILSCSQDKNNSVSGEHTDKHRLDRTMTVTCRTWDNKTCCHDNKPRNAFFIFYMKQLPSTTTVKRKQHIIVITMEYSCVFFFTELNLRLKRQTNLWTSVRWFHWYLLTHTIVYYNIFVLKYQYL